MSGINNSPLVSILIFSYNHDKYIKECLDSILEQNYENIELIIIDDFSQDNTWSIIQSYKEKSKKRFKRINFLKKNSNMGVIDSINTGVKMALGEFIFMCASDDKLSSESTIIKLVNTIKKLPEEYGVLCCNNLIIDIDSNQCYWDKNLKIVYNKNKTVFTTFADFLQNENPDIDFSTDDFGSYETILRGNYICNGFLVKSLCLKELLPLKNDSLEDWQIHLSISKKYRYKYLDEILFSYRWHDSNSIKNHAKIFERELSACLAEKEYCQQNGLSELWFQRYSEIQKKIKSQNLKQKWPLIYKLLRYMLYFRKES